MGWVSNDPSFLNVSGKGKDNKTKGTNFITMNADVLYINV